MKRIFLTLILLLFSITSVEAKQLIISTPLTVSVNTEITSEIDLVLESDASFAISNGITLTISGPFRDPGLRQVFTGVGIVAFGVGATPYVRGEWQGTLSGAGDVSAAAQRSLNTAVASGVPLRLDATGTYTISSQILTGNTAATTSKKVAIYGAGIGMTRIAGNVADGIIKIMGPNPNLDGAGNRHNGRIDIQDISFSATGLTGSAIHVYGAQGVHISDVYATGFDKAIKFSNVDLATIERCHLTQSNYGFFSQDVGALFQYGILNSFIFTKNIVDHNTVGVYYYGGTAPVISDNNFVVNGSSLVFSDDFFVGGGLTPSTINLNGHGNYFESDTSNPVIMGGVGGYMRGGSFERNSFLMTDGTTGIQVKQITGTPGGIGGTLQLNHNFMAIDGLGGTFTSIDQSASTVKGDFDTYDQIPIGTVVPAASVTSYIFNTKTFTKVVAASGSADLFSIGSYGVTFSGLLTIRASSSGRVTIKQYMLLGVGGSVATVWTALADKDYTTPSPFTFAETQNSPVAGTNKYSLTNTDSVEATFDCSLIIFTNTGTLTYM